MISIQYFENLVGMLMGHPPEMCGMSGICSCQFIIEADGGVYPCDFYVTDEWYLGNIHKMDYDEIKSCETAKKFIDVSTHIDPECRNCAFASLCRGGCRRYREPFVDGKPSLNYYCSSFRSFFEHSATRLERLASMLSHR